MFKNLSYEPLFRLRQQSYSCPLLHIDMVEMLMVVLTVLVMQMMEAVVWLLEEVGEVMVVLSTGCSEITSWL